MHKGNFANNSFFSFSGRAAVIFCAARYSCIFVLASRVIALAQEIHAYVGAPFKKGVL